ncbi:hypothetical protein HMPREF9695_03593 [Afipia broomeae ATCC 49717]|uniref:Uncharacterized protein n=1 Tax=Afipia broomeae ATCC 49717 TaxID=883078 RepID=K8PC33_9BRAD|nr:hypothetical protein HMPREF9695_03593 [Afipia broomeae ATCC 49717]
MYADRSRPVAFRRGIARDAARFVMRAAKASKLATSLIWMATKTALIEQIRSLCMQRVKMRIRSAYSCWDRKNDTTISWRDWPAIEWFGRSYM